MLAATPKAPKTSDCTSTHRTKNNLNFLNPEAKLYLTHEARVGLIGISLNGQIAQLVEQGTENPCVDSSILSLAIENSSVSQ